MGQKVTAVITLQGAEADDKSDFLLPEQHFVREVLEEAARADPRVKVAFRRRNGHIAAATNTALELASGELVCFLDHDDRLAPHALYCLAEELLATPELGLIYSDEDKLDSLGRRCVQTAVRCWSMRSTATP